MKLLKSPNKWLQKEVEPFDFDKYNAEEVSQSMIALMAQEGGIGLSANQVGLNARIFVMKPHLLEDNSPLTVINPTIDKVSINQETMPEGCLSHPDLFLKVTRPKGLVVKFLDIDAKECIMELYDLDARCLLHEYDHLAGIEFTNRVSRLKLDMARKKQTKIRKTING